MYGVPAWRSWVPLALVGLAALAFLLLAGGHEKRAEGFYTIRPLDWWGRGDTVHVILWNPGKSTVDVNVSGDISCLVSIPPFSAADAACRTSPASPGEYRDMNVCIDGECGKVSLVFD